MATNEIEFEQGTTVEWALDDEGEEYRRVRPWTTNEIRDHPMFMTEVPQDISNNKYLLALQSMTYDNETPETMAAKFKDMGNEALKAEGTDKKIQHHNALLCYTKALEMESRLPVQNALIHANRAMVSLKLQEYTRCVDDCRAVFRLEEQAQHEKANGPPPPPEADPKRPLGWGQETEVDRTKAPELVPEATVAKCCYRALQASLALGLARDAVMYGERARTLLAGDNPALREVCTELKKARALLARLNKSRAAQAQTAKEKEDQLQRERTALEEELKRRHVQRVGPPLFDMSLYRLSDSQCYPSKSADNPEEILWPVMTLYDEVNQSDYLQQFSDQLTPMDLLKKLFETPAPWDDQGRYTKPEEMAVFVEFYKDWDGTGRSATALRPCPLDKTFAVSLRGARVPAVIPCHVVLKGTDAEYHLRDELDVEDI